MQRGRRILGTSLDRRRFLARLGAAGLTVVASPGWVRAQEEGTPAPVATPVAGLRPDGTRLWRVQSGFMSEEDLIEVALYFPDKLTINAGDSVYFNLGEFHTVTFLGGQEAPPLIMPEPANGSPTAEQPLPMYNPEALFPIGGTTVDGTTYVNSGAPIDPSMPPFVVDFPKEGSYDFVCLVHRSIMKGTITVQAQGSTLPYEQTDYDQQSADKQAQLLAQGKALIAQAEAAAMASPAAGDGPTTWEVSAGLTDDTIDVVKFVPDTLTIKAGDTVRWTYHGKAEPHTVTFLGGSEPPQDPLVEPQAGGPPSVFENPLVFYPQGGGSYDGTALTGSGFMGADPALLAMAPPAGTTYELTFPTAGTYQYYCSLHGDPVQGQGMVGKITVS
jgi:plastocyanin